MLLDAFKQSAPASKTSGAKARFVAGRLICSAKALLHPAVTFKSSSLDFARDDRAKARFVAGRLICSAKALLHPLAVAFKSRSLDFARDDRAEARNVGGRVICSAKGLLHPLLVTLKSRSLDFTRDDRADRMTFDFPARGLMTEPEKKAAPPAHLVASWLCESVPHPGDCPKISDQGTHSNPRPAFGPHL